MIRPLRDLLVVRFDKEPNKWGDIFLPDSTSTRLQQYFGADVLGAGPQCEVKAGQRVIVSEYFGLANDLTEFEGERVRIGRERDIVGIDMREPTKAA